MVSLNATLGPTGKLSPQPWMSAPATRAVIAALTAKGSDVRFIGGCVRDSLAKREVKDIDIATPDKPETVMALLRDAGIKAVATGIDHGSITAIADGVKFEITTLRVDVTTDGRHARVAYTDDWIADAHRRDFTINALSATPDGNIFDPFDGISDLSHGRVCFVGLADERINEDVLRILRFFRFFGLFGRPPADQDALAACRANADKLTGLSGERIRDELFKILLVPEPADAAVTMRGNDIFEPILPEVGDPGRLRMVSWLETRAIKIDSVQPDALRRLAALVRTDSEGADAIARRLRLSNRDTLRFGTLIEPPVDMDPDMEDTARRKALHRLGPDVVRDLTILAWASELSITPRIPAARTQGWIDILNACDEWTAPAFPLAGADVIALGIEEGPNVGRILAEVEDWWEEGDFKASRDECLARLQQVVG